MAFKTVKSYNDEKFNGLFLLRNDGDYADVIFMYRNEDDALIAETHYIKSADYSGYVHCIGRGCPACAKDIRVQTKLFIPLYNITDNELQFWDRSNRFESQLMHDVFQQYPNPSEYVFRITRHGAAGSIDTTYEIVGISKNTYKSYSQILAENNASFPEYYNKVCREWTGDQMYNALNTSANSSYGYGDNMPNYQPQPRHSGYSSSSAGSISTDDYKMPEAPVVSAPVLSSNDSDEGAANIDVMADVSDEEIDDDVNF